MNQASSKNPPTLASAKSLADNKGQQQAALAARRGVEWQVVAALVLLAAGILRLLYLDLKPLHHDEGVNGGYFMTRLFRTGYYHYDPANYHGPTLYYAGLITTTLNALFYGKEGLSTFAIRLVPAVFGIALVGLVLCLRRYLGAVGALAAAALLAVSPGMVYFSRYFIHEMLFVFLTLALVLTVLFYRETRQPRYLMLAAASAALMFATKETCIISYAVLALAWGCSRLYLRMVKRPELPAASTMSQQSAVISDSGTAWDRLRWPALAALLFVVISVLFFSSFFTNFPQGVIDSLRTFQIWTHRGVQTDQYRAPWFTYLDWLRREELPILLLGGLGIVIALVKAKNGFAVFTAFWALGITAAYSLLPYKTPWLALNLILPLSIAGGHAVSERNGKGAFRRASLILIFLAAMSTSFYQTIDLNFFRYDDNSIPYVYAHTSRRLLDLVDELESVAAREPTGYNTGMTIVSDVYWPLPWYLRDYPQAVFWGRIVPTSEPILIASGIQGPEIEKEFGHNYRLYRAYDLRPGNVLVLYLRRDVQP